MKMNIKFVKNNLTELNSYVGFIVLLISMYVFESTTWTSFNDSFFHDVILGCTLMFAISCMLLKKSSLKEKFVFGILMCIGLLCYISTRFTGLLLTFLAVTLIPRNSIDKVFRIIFIEELFLTICIILLSLIGILPNQVVEINKSLYTVNAYTFGFNHPNILTAQATTIVFLYLCVNRNNVQIKTILISLISTLLIFYFSRGRTAFLLSLLTIILICIDKTGKFNSIKSSIFKYLPYLNIVIILTILIVIILFAFFGGYSRLINLINDLIFNGRIGLAWLNFKAYPMSLFGVNLDPSVWPEWQYHSLDNGHMMIFLQYGVIGFIAYFYIVQRALNNIANRKDIVMCIIISVLLIWLIYEGTMSYVGKNFTLLFAFYRGKSGSKKKGVKQNVT